MTEYGFAHILVRDVAYGEIPRTERAAKHLLAAGWIESLGRREDQAEMLAHHYVAALESSARRVWRRVSSPSAPGSRCGTPATVRWR